MTLNDASTAIKLSSLINHRSPHGSAVRVVCTNQITNSLNRGEVIARTFWSWRVHPWASAALCSSTVNSNLSSATHRSRSSGVAIVIHNYMAICERIQELDSPTPSLHRLHEYDTDVTLWLHAFRTACGSLHRCNSNERQLSPPGSAARPSKSCLECACTKTRVPRSGGDCVVAGNGCEGWTEAIIGETMVRSSSRGKWGILYKSR